MRLRSAAVSLLALGAISCTGPSSSPSSTTLSPTTSSTTTTAIQLTTSTTAAAPMTTSTQGGPTELLTYGDGPPIPIESDTYVTALPWGFFPGLTLSVSDEWMLGENDAGEFRLHQKDHPDNILFIWKDMAAVVTNNREQNLGQRRFDIGTTAEELTTYLTTSDDFVLLTQPENVTVGTVEGTQFTFQVSDTADFDEPDCPFNPKCADILTHPLYWEGAWGIGGDETVRMFIATVSYPEGDHTFFIVLDAPNQQDLAELAAAAEPVIQSLKLPTAYIVNHD